MDRAPWKPLHGWQGLDEFVVAFWPVWPDWAIYWTFGHFSKPLAAISLPKSSTFLGNFCEGVKIFNFSSEIIFGQLLSTFGDFLLVTQFPTKQGFRLCTSGDGSAFIPGSGPRFGSAEHPRANHGGGGGGVRPKPRLGERNKLFYTYIAFAKPR